jgi:hypothetical protein
VRESSLRLRVGEISGRIGSSQLSKKRTEGWCLEALKGGVTSLCCRRVSFAEKYLVKIRKNCPRRNKRSEFFEKNS